MNTVPLTSYFLVVAAWRREIALGAALTAAAGGLAILLLSALSPRYEASADVAIIHTDTTVALDETFQTNTSQQRNQRRWDSQALAARRASLLGLVTSGDILEAVTEQMDWEEQPTPLDKAKLLQLVSAELVTIGSVSTSNQSDLIRITLLGETPAASVTLANLWVGEYVARVNQIYSPTHQTLLDSVSRELDAAKVRYHEAHSRLVDFLDTSDLGLLRRRVELLTQEIDSTKASHSTALDTSLNQRFVGEKLMLEENYATRRKLNTLMDNAVALQRQIKNAGKASIATNAMALQILKLQAFGTSSASSGIEISIADSIPVHAGLSEQLADVNGLIYALKEQLAKLNLNIQQRIEALGSFKADFSGAPTPSSPEDALVNSRPSMIETDIEGTIMKLELQVRDLNSQIENEDAMLTLLNREREIAFTKMDTLQNEAVELQLTAVGAPSIVRLGSPAVGAESTWPSPILIAAVMGIGALPILSFIALLMNSVGAQPFLSTELGGADLRGRASTPAPSPKGELANPSP